MPLSDYFVWIRVSARRDASCFSFPSFFPPFFFHFPRRKEYRATRLALWNITVALQHFSRSLSHSSSIITTGSLCLQVARSSPTTAVTAQSAPRTLCMRSGLYQGWVFTAFIVAVYLLFSQLYPSNADSFRVVANLLRGQILSRSRLISALSLVDRSLERASATVCEPKRRYIFRNREVSSERAYAR